MRGTTAIATGEYGYGRVICFSPHPEKTSGFESMLLSGVHRVAPSQPMKSKEAVKNLFPPEIKQRSFGDDPRESDNSERQK
jgi:hypothetical protein